MVLPHADRKPCYYYPRRRNSKDFLKKQEICYQSDVYCSCRTSEVRQDSKGRVNGKIGIWPIVATNPARRFSINRPKGAPETTPLTVDKAIYKKLLIEKVFPAIRDLFPSGTGRSIYVQQDNAKPHSCWNDPIIQQEARRGGWKIKLQNQPPNSPDLNVLDLGFFRSIQSLQEKKSTRNLNDLIAAVSKAFDDVSSQTLLKNFVT